MRNVDFCLRWPFSTKSLKVQNIIILLLDGSYLLITGYALELKQCEISKRNENFVPGEAFYIQPKEISH